MQARRKPESDLQTLHRQLNNDFDVHTYLQQHQLDLDNTENYAQLLNNLVLSRRRRMKHLLSLKSVKTLENEPKEREPHREFERIEERTGIEGEITKNLQREITQTKKSLNLLRGDIGFLVSRNESAQLLNSKICKVKIVALDQLKRVSLAFSKDKEEIKIRNEMQRKFGKKLKNISGYESASLSRLKEYYVEGQLRRNEVEKKLYASQLQRESGQEMEGIRRRKELIDRGNRERELRLIELGRVITRFSREGREGWGSQSSANLVGKIERYLQEVELPQEAEEGEVQSAIDTILEQYHALKDSIKGLSNFYNQQLKAKQELGSKIKQCQEEQHELLLKFELQSLYGYIISGQQRKEYQDKLKQFAAILRSYFKLLAYFERSDRKPERQERRRYSSFQSEENIKYSAYITQLHALYQLLTSEEPSELVLAPEYSSAQAISNFYDNMARDINQWLSLLKLKISQGEYYPVQRRAYHKQTMYSQPSQFLIPLELIYSEYHQPNKEPESQPEAQMSNKTEETIGKAKRIRLLEDVDRDYYKMIKATMKMQKENTRKNYQFQRVFKRAKYASRDDILQEKRFEASFSVLFTKQSSPALTRAFGLDSRNSTLKGMANTVHYESAFKPRKGVVLEGRREGRMRRSMGEEGQKTRLGEKLREALKYSAF